MTLFSSLTNRIFFASAALAVLAISVAVYRVNVAVTTQAENELRRGLEEAGTLLEQYRSTLFEHFSSEARLVADLPVLKAAVYTGDPPTVRPIAEGYQRGIGSDLFVVTDPTGGVLAQAGRIPLPADASIVRDTIAQATGGHEVVALWPHAGGVLQVVSVPSYVSTELVGTVTVGFSLDREALARFKALTNSEIAFAVGDRLQASTLPPALDPALARLIGSSGVQEITVEGDEYVALSRPLAVTLSPGGPSSPVPPLSALILRSRTERLRFLSAIHRDLAVTAVLAVLAATLLSYAVARTVTRPLGAITATMREMAATGDLTRRIPAGSGARWDDEDARLLASTFNTMTDSIARFQREKAQRERLSSLGRLSTVVAHEIRNPLMIIKATLRGLKRRDVTPDVARAAAADIDEEVARLNRIVSEVLDFARPIKFDRAPADLNALCEDVVRATSAEDPTLPVEARLDPTLSAIDTDGERLRLALVNILTNARHAVRARYAETPPPAGAIRLRTSHGHNGHATIEIQDRGTGIAPDDLPRVFDPYFTTRRTGTGLGLAISRNIIEGLGGRISVSSHKGEGTRVVIEL